MSPFTRYAAVAVVVLSLGFLVASAPVTSYATIPAVTGKDTVSLAIANLCLGLEAKMHDLLSCSTAAELKLAAAPLVSVFKACSDELLKISADVVVVVEAEAKLNIAACFVAIITLFVQVCTQLVIKLGLSVVATVCAEMDVVVRLCLVHLEACVGGIIALIAKEITSATVDVLAQFSLNLCLQVLGLKI